MATITISLMDPPYETETTTTAFRIMDAAIRKGHAVNVFAYEGAVNLGFSKQAPHPNAVHGRDVEQEDHPLPKDWVANIRAVAASKGATLDWINCGLCEDERGANDSIEGIRRGTPGDLWKWTQASTNTLVIPTRS